MLRLCGPAMEENKNTDIIDKRKRDADHARKYRERILHLQQYSHTLNLLYFFFIVKKVVICFRIPTVCWTDGKTFLFQRKYTTESLVPKPSAVDGRDALWKVEGRSYDIVQISLEMFQSGGRIMLSAIHIIKYNHNMGQLSKKKGSIIIPIKQVDRNR